MSELVRLSAQMSKGLRKHLAEGGVPDIVLDFIKNPQFPDKMAKWLGFTLRDELGDASSPEEAQRKLDLLKDDILYIRDFYQGEQGVDLFQYEDVADARRAAEEWHERIAEEMKEKGDPSLYEYPNFNAIPLEHGFQMVQINPMNPYNDLVNEGNLMGHCVGSGGYEEAVRSGESQIWSLRAPDGEPHATIELTAPGYGSQDYDLYDAYYDDDPQGMTIEQIQGKENKPIVEKYKPLVHQWLSDEIESGHVDADETDLIKVMPQSMLFEKILQDPKNASQYIQHLSDETHPELERLIIEKEGILDDMSLASLEATLSHFEPNNPRNEMNPQLVDVFRKRMLNFTPDEREGEGPLDRSYMLHHYLKGLLFDRPGTQEDGIETAIKTLSSPDPELRRSAMHLLFSEDMWNTGYINEFQESPRAKQLLLNVLRNETNPSVLRIALDALNQDFRSTDDGRLISDNPLWSEDPESVIGALTEAHRKLGEEGRYLTVQHEIQKLLALLAPSGLHQILPEVNTNEGYVWRNWSDMMSILRQVYKNHGPEALREALGYVPQPFVDRIMSPDVVNQITGPDANEMKQILYNDTFDVMQDWHSERPAVQAMSLASRLDHRGAHDLSDRLDLLFGSDDE